MVANSLTWWFQSLEKAQTSLYVGIHNIIWIYIILIHIMWIHALGIHVYHMNSYMDLFQTNSYIFWLTWVADQAFSVVFLWKSNHVDKLQEFHWTSFCFPIALKASLLLMCIYMSEFFHDLSYICIFILGIQNLCRKAFESIFIKDLIFDLDVEHAFHDVEFIWIQLFQVDKVGWSNQPIPCSFWTVGLESSLG